MLPFAYKIPTLANSESLTARLLRLSAALSRLVMEMFYDDLTKALDALAATHERSGSRLMVKHVDVPHHYFLWLWTVSPQNATWNVDIYGMPGNKVELTSSHLFMNPREDRSETLRMTPDEALAFIQIEECDCRYG